MVYVRRHRLGNTCFAQLLTPQKNVLFDYHALLYGRSHRHPSFGSPPRPLKFVVKDVRNVDCVFVASSDSIGCFFAGEGVRVYCTKPVHDQLMLLYDEYSSMLVTYDEDPQALQPGHRTVLLSEVDMEGLRKNITLIKYEQRISLGSATVCAVSAGTFVGWANYRILFSNGESLTYLASYSHKRRFSAEAAPVDTTYLIISREDPGDASDLGAFTEFLRLEFGDGTAEAPPRTAVVPVRIPTLFVEVFFHVLSVLGGTGAPIHVVSPVFRRLELLANIQSEWLNRDFSSLAEPFPMRQYAGLSCTDSFNCAFQDRPQIVFCSELSYGLLASRRLFRSQTDVLINSTHASPAPGRSIRRFNIKIESSNSEILSGYAGTLIDAEDHFISTEPRHKTLNLDRNMNIVGGIVYMSGTLLHTDFHSGADTAITLRDGRSWVKELVDAGGYAVVDDWLVFREKRLKCRFLNDLQVEYKFF